MRCIYLNAASQSLLPAEILRAMDRYRAEYEENPTAGWVNAWGRLWEVQGELARFLGARDRDLFLRVNVTSVLNCFLNGVPLPKGSEILVGEWEYGAILNICRQRAIRDSLKLRILKIPISLYRAEKLNAATLVEEIVSQLGSSTRLILLSHVFGGSGLKIPLAEIAKETRRRGIYLVVDGAYAVGAIPIDFSKLNDVDFYAGSLYKWMLGPKGTAFGWVAERNQKTLGNTESGWTTFEATDHFKAFGGGSRFQEVFMLSGLHDFAPFFAISDVVAMWRQLGSDTIQRRIRELCATVRLESRNALHVESEIAGTMVAVKTSGAIEIGRRAVEKGIQIGTARLGDGEYLVYSPHIYNNESQIRAAHSVLAEIH